MLEQTGTAKKLTGQILENWLVSYADGHGGIQSLVKTSSSGTDPVVDVYTITYADQTTSSFTVTNGVKGDTGDQTYVWIKYAAQYPTSDSDMGSSPDDWIGIYSGTASTAPTHYTDYTWFAWKGEQGDTGDPAELESAVISYCQSDSGTVVPESGWSSSVPTPTGGMYLWTRIVLSFNTGDPITYYSVTRYGIDGQGAVVTVNNVSPDSNGNVSLTEDNIPFVPKDVFSTIQRVAVCGDSYSSIQLYPDSGSTASNVSWLSWVELLANKTGKKILNFSHGGYTVANWYTNYYSQASFANNLAQVYVITLGLNDVNQSVTIGTTADIKTNPDQNPNTFIGNYAKIIQKLTALQPNAKFLCVTMPVNIGEASVNYQQYNTAIRSTANYFTNAFVVDLYTDWRQYFTDSSSILYQPDGQGVFNGHYTAEVQGELAEVFHAAFNKTILDNFDAFKQIDVTGKTWKPYYDIPSYGNNEYGSLASKAYAENDYINVNDKIYRALIPINAGASFSVGTNVVESSVLDAITTAGLSSNTTISNGTSVKFRMRYSCLIVATRIDQTVGAVYMLDFWSPTAKVLTIPTLNEPSFTFTKSTNSREFTITSSTAAGVSLYVLGAVIVP